jgi:hypothetical protein
MLFFNYRPHYSWKSIQVLSIIIKGILAGKRTYFLGRIVCYKMEWLQWLLLIALKTVLPLRYFI